MKKKIIIFLLCWLIYLAIGIYYGELANKINSIFGADNFRVIEDMTVFSGSHFRTKVHPLFVILINPFGLLLNLIVKNRVTTSFILNSFCGAISVVIMYEYLKKTDIKNCYRICLVIIYAMSFSTIIYASFPETFIFGATTLIFNQYLAKIILLEKDCNQKRKKHYCLFVVSIILCFGITITNYIPAIIMLIPIVYSTNNEFINNFFGKYKLLNLSKKKFYIIICALSLLLGTLGTIGQKIIYKGSGLYFSSEIIDEIGFMKIGDKNLLEFTKNLIVKNENIKIMIEQARGKEFNFEKTDEAIMSKEKISFFQQSKNVLKIFFQYSLIGPIPNEDEENVITYEVDSDNNYNFIEKISVSMWTIVVLGSIFYSLKNKIFINYYIVLCILFNILLHFIYGANESFLYTAHIFFLFVLLLGNTLEFLQKKQSKLCGVYYLIFLMIIPIMIVSNFKLIILIKELLTT